MSPFELTVNDEMIAWLKVLSRATDTEEISYHGFFPNEDVSTCLDVNLDPLLFRYKKPCPLCTKPSHQLRWVRFSSPADAWARGGGVLGPLSLCDHCGVQVQFLSEQ